MLVTSFHSSLKTTWLKRIFTTIALAIVAAVSALAQDDAPGCKDSPMFNKMPYMAIADCSSSYDEMEVPMANNQIEKKKGTRTTIQYNYRLEEASAPSFFKIVKNFESVITSTGGRRVYYSKDADVATLFTRLAGKAVWVVLKDYSGARTGNFELNILEIKSMNYQKTASDLSEMINTFGTVALLIELETGKSIIKPGLQPVPYCESA